MGQGGRAGHGGRGTETGVLAPALYDLFVLGSALEMTMLVSVFCGSGTTVPDDMSAKLFLFCACAKCFACDSIQESHLAARSDMFVLFMIMIVMVTK